MPALELTLLGTGSPVHVPHRFGHGVAAGDDVVQQHRLAALGEAGLGQADLHVAVAEPRNRA